MKLCSRHFEDLKDALKKKDLWRFVNLDSQTMEMRVKKWLDGLSQRHELDPFIIAILEINKKAMEMLPAHYCGHQNCPLCSVGKVLGSQADKIWIDNCTDAVLTVFHVNGLTLNYVEPAFK